MDKKIHVHSPRGDFRVIKEKYVPEIESSLRKKPVLVPKPIYNASGIRVQGTRIKSFVFSTDIAIIKNCNAQAVLAVYPFTPQLSIIQAIIQASSIPVFAGVGGGTTTGPRSINIALQAELLGAFGVVVNAPMKNDVIAEMYKALDIPIVATIASENDDVVGKINAGARILNISGGKNTPELIKKVRSLIGPEFPIIGTGGPTDEMIQTTIDSGANSITFTPPSNAELFTDMMQHYREIHQEKENPNRREDLHIDDFQQDLVFSDDAIEYIDEVEDLNSK